MRLYLSSHRLGTAPDALVALLRGGTRIGVVAHAADDLEADERAARVQREVDDLTAIGLDAAEIDLYRSDLAACDGLWVLGGNAAALRTALGSSGADEVIVTRLRDDSLVYAGYSAGACILGPSPALAVASTTGLDLLPYAIAPHHGTQQGPEGPTGLADHYTEHHIPFVALRDGQAIVVDGDETRVVS